MIFACPSCSASHFKPDAEAKAGVTLACRRCKTRFRVTAAGVEPLPPEEAAPATADAGTAVVAEAIAAESTKTQTDAPQFEGGSTDVMKMPQGIAPGGLADALEPEPEAADADMIETIESAESIEDVAAAHDAYAAPSAQQGDFAPTPMSHESSTTAGGDPLGPGEVTLANDGLGDLSSLSAAASAGPASQSTPFDGGSSGLPSFSHTGEIAVAVVLEEQPTVVTDEPPANAIAELERGNAAQARSVDSGSGTFDPVMAAQKPDKPKKSKSSQPSALGIYARDVARSFSTGTPARKTMMLGIPLALLLAAIVIVALNRGPPPLHRQWITSPASMWSGPAAQRGYAQVDTLIRGEEVIFLREVFGEYSLIRDQWGRVGYINRESLTDERPPVTPESSFPGCRQAPIESDKEPCETRARALHDACGGTCSADGRCLQRCQDRFTECIDGCKTRLTVPQAVAAVPEPIEPVDTVVADEPTEQVDKVAAEKPIKTSKVTKTTRTTKKTTAKKDTGKKKH